MVFYTCYLLLFTPPHILKHPNKMPISSLSTSFIFNSTFSFLFRKPMKFSLYMFPSKLVGKEQKKRILLIRKLHSTMHSPPLRIGGEPPSSAPQACISRCNSSRTMRCKCCRPEPSTRNLCSAIGIYTIIQWVLEYRFHIRLTSGQTEGKNMITICFSSSTYEFLCFIIYFLKCFRNQSNRF